MAKDSFFTDSELVEAKRMRAEGASFSGIAKAFGCDHNTIRRRLDPAWAQKQRDKRRDYGEQKKPKGSMRWMSKMMEHKNEPSKEDVKRARALIPQDTRTEFQRLVGDPIYERSALYKKLNPDA